MHLHSKNKNKPTGIPWPFQLLSACIVLIAGFILGQFSSIASAQSESFTPTWPLVIDRANLLDSEQEQTAVVDAWWLNSMGTPFQVVTESAAATPQSAHQRAAELRIDHRIESRTGADDGILLYAAVNPGNRSDVVIGIAPGAEATSGSGLTAESVKNVTDTIVATQLEAGHPARAIVYSIREMMYLRTFVPPSEPLPTGWRAEAQRPLTYIGPSIAIISAAVTLFGPRRAPGSPNIPWVLAGLLACVASALLVLSVQAQSGAGVVFGFAIVAMSVHCTILADRRQRDLNTRTLVVTPRPPGTRLSAGSRL